MTGLKAKKARLTRAFLIDISIFVFIEEGIW